VRQLNVGNTVRYKDHVAANGESDGTAQRRRVWRSTVLAFAGYLVLALYVTRHLLWLPGSHILAINGPDQLTFEWVLFHAAHSLGNPSALLFTHLVNWPSGVNLMGNTSMPLVGVLASPVTLLFGPSFSFAFVLTMNLVLTALAWRWFFARKLHIEGASTIQHDVAATVGGLMCAFGPAMMAHSLGHPNLTAQWLVPFMVYLAINMSSSKNIARDGALLGLLATAQVFVAEEVLLLTALGIALFLLMRLLMSPRSGGAGFTRLVGGLVVALAVALPLLAYPLWFQFGGPQSYGRVPFNQAVLSVDAANYLHFPSRTIAGNPNAPATFNLSQTEEVAQLGWPLLIALVIAVAWLWRDARIRALALSVLVLGALALGPKPTWHGHPIPFPSLWHWWHHVPTVNSALPIRVPLVIGPMIAAVAVLCIRYAVKRGRTATIAVATVLVASLLPLFPVPIPVTTRDPLQPFITAGLWKQCTPVGGVLATAPLATGAFRAPLQWQTAAGQQFAIPQGPFFGPSPTKGLGQMGATPSLTSFLIDVMRTRNQLPKLTPGLKKIIVRDIAGLHANCLAVMPGQVGTPSIMRLIVWALGQPTLIGGVPTWDIQHL